MHDRIGALDTLCEYTRIAHHVRNAPSLQGIHLVDAAKRLLVHQELAGSPGRAADDVLARRARASRGIHRVHPPRPRETPGPLSLRWSGHHTPALHEPSHLQVRVVQLRARALPSLHAQRQRTCDPGHVLLTGHLFHTLQSFLLQVIAQRFQGVSEAIIVQDCLISLTS